MNFDPNVLKERHSEMARVYEEGAIRDQILAKAKVRAAKAKPAK